VEAADPSTSSKQTCSVLRQADPVLKGWVHTGPSVQKTLERITSEEPTDYRVIKLNGKKLFVYCALDTVLYSVLTGERVEVETKIRGKNVRFILTPDTKLMVSFIDPISSDKLPSSADTPSSLCPFLRFFEDSSQFHGWRKTLPPSVQSLVTLISVKDAFALVERFIKEEKGVTK
jgi:hypothetical protein